MARCKMTDHVRHPQTGEVATVGAFADRGLITFREVGNFLVRGGNTRTAYFADIKGTMAGWEIGKLAYQSRAKAHDQGVHRP